MSAKHVTDMTTGSPVKHILLFALPLLVGNIFQQMYNMVDSIIVGNFVGANALAAVGACGSLNFLFFSLSSGLSIGIGVIVSQYFGAGDIPFVKKTIANAVYVLAAAAVTVSILGILLAPQILHLLGTPPKVIGDSIVYLRTTCAGILAVAAYNGIASILRALGDSRTPLYFLILASFINVGLDLTFVLGLHWGVFGVALATIIAQAAAAVTCIFYAYKKVPFFKLGKEQLRPDGKIILNSIRLGIPIAFQNSLIAISCIILQGVVNSFGETVMAAYSITNRIEQVVQQPFASLAMAVTTFTGQNIGAGHTDRVKKGFVKGTAIALAFSLSMLPVAYLFGESIVRAFVKDPEVIAIGARALRITSLCYFPLGMIYVPRGLLNGAGDARFAMINGATEVSCRILFSNVLTRLPVLGYWGIWITSGATWFVTAVVCTCRYFSGIWMRRGFTKKTERYSTNEK